MITLQNPHGIPPASTSTVATTKTAQAEKAKTVVSKSSAGSTSAAGPKKKDVPCAFVATTVEIYMLTSCLGNISPYSSGLPGASLTSTSVDPQTQSAQLLWDEVSLFYFETSSPQCTMLIIRFYF